MTTNEQFAKLYKTNKSIRDRVNKFLGEKDDK